MAEKEYIIPYSEVARKRHYHETVKGRITRFMVQLEIKHKGNWKQALRYDCAHGYAHRDCYNLIGEHTKDELYLNFEDALTLADEDIDDNWDSYKSRFLGGDPL